MAITAGGGAAQVTVDVINATFDLAQGKSNDGKEWINQAIASAEPAPQMGVPVLDTSYLPPDEPDLPSSSALDAQAMYDASYAQIQALIGDGLTDFISTYYPNDNYFGAALDWIERALTTGGTGVNPIVEQQLWERDRARIQRDLARAEQEVFSTWANRGFPLPPGAATSQVQQIRLEASRQLAGQSRDIAIKAFEAELENARTALSAALSTRTAALAAASEYIRTLVVGPQVSMQLATGLAGLENDVARTLVSFYQARTAALDPHVRLSIADAQIKEQGSEANLRSKVQSVQNISQAAIEAARMFSTQAAGALNAIGGRASISGQDSSSV